MNNTRVALLVLSMLVAGAAAHRLLAANSAKAASLADAAEHQRILSELEEVHQLRERMLQEGEPPRMNVFHVSDVVKCFEDDSLFSPPAQLPFCNSSHACRHVIHWTLQLS